MGGIYAELVKNRSFEFFQPLMGWDVTISDSSKAQLTIMNETTSKPYNPRHAKAVIADSVSFIKMTNTGFRGMGLKKDLTYKFSMLAKSTNLSPMVVIIELKDANNKIVGSGKITVVSVDWAKQEVTVTSDQTIAKGSMSITIKGKGMLEFDMVSLFPSDTWKNRPNGLRADLVQLLADLKPGFLRFPGGCIVEGRELATRYQWKKTIGPVEERTMIVNRWNTEFRHRLTPDYFQTFGLGFFEYFQLAEDIGAEPLPILSCGIACQFNTGELVPVNDLDPYIQDALDLIEFANGDANTTWGKVRTDMGHPEPFNLKMIGVGNEQWGPQYFERYVPFEKAIKAKYPNIKIVSGSGPFPDGKEFDYAWDALKKFNAEIIDEHYYRHPDWFLSNANRYDNYDRNGPKVFAGEYAAQSDAIASPDNKNFWECALSEAAFMTGLERNAGVVWLSSYAPLFGHVDGWQWTPNLIWFDNLTSFGTANYQVQKLFSNNKGNVVVESGIKGKAVEGESGLYVSSVKDTKTNELIVKLVNANANVIIPELSVEGAKRSTDEYILTQLQSSDLKVINSINEPGKIVPVTKTINTKGQKVKIELPAYSVSVVRFKL